MNKNYLKIFSITLFLFANQIVAQQRNLWSKIDETKISNTQLERKTNIKKYQTFQLKISALRNNLKNAPTKNIVLKNSKFKMQFPDESGKMISFWVKEAPVMHPDLAKKFPNNKSYVGVGIEDNSVKIRFSVNELGLHAMIITKDRKVQYINPATKDKRYYKVYAREDLSMNNIDFQCFSKNFESVKKSAIVAINLPDDGKLRTYRLALASTGEYSQFHINEAGVGGGTDEEKKAVVMAAMTTAITRVNAVFENDLAISFEIISNNDDIIFLNGNTDPYDNDDGSAMLDQNQTTCDNDIGSANYDIGHVLSTGGGGVAILESICTGPAKAKGVTGSDNPTGDNFYFDFIAHELGHQLGANHTFNGDEGSCGEGTRNDATAYEPGSGTTLMAYAGLCTPQNVQQHSDLYFHAISIDEIWTNIISGSNNCATTTNFVNNINVPTANAGNDFIIPKSTPYKLIGQGTDADGDPITFTWEQMNNEINNIPPEETDAIGTLYRSVKPSTENYRYLPQLNTVIGGNLSSKWEVTPSVARDINFTLTVRDNNIEGGQIDSDEMKVTVNDTAGPFEVTSQSASGVVWNEGATKNITWNVAGTTNNGINVSNVNILLSTDGGKTFPIMLTANTPNDGSQDITVPNNTAPNCRIMVEANGNIFYAVNEEAFSIGEFTTECTNYDSVDVPKNIPDNDSFGVISTINVTDDNLLMDVKVSVEITHTWIGDITLVLESPEGTLVELISGECFGNGNEDMNVIFDDNGSVLVCESAAPVISGNIIPSQELSNFSNENPLGIWKLKVIDENPADFGDLNNWSLEICTSQPLSTNNYSLNNFNIYPNPSQGVFNVSFIKDYENVEIYVYDLLGRKVNYKKYNEPTEFFDEIINLSGLSRGIYLLQVKNGNHFSSKKIQIN